MKKMKLLAVILVASVFILSFSAYSYAVPLLAENFDNLTNWTNGDYNNGISEISTYGGGSFLGEGGYLHQFAPGNHDYASVTRTFAGVGSGDYNFEMRFLFSALPSSLNSYWLDIGGQLNSLRLYFYDDSLRVYNGSSVATAFGQSWAVDTWYVLTGVVHDSQSLADFYLNGLLQASNVDVSWTFSNDGFLRLASNINLTNSGDEWYVDYLNINEGEFLEVIPEPASMILLGSLATGLFGMAGIRRKKEQKA